MLQHHYSTRFLAVAFALLPLFSLLAQTPEHLRADSVLLSVYNTGKLYRLTPASFAPRTPSAELLTDMVWLSDTVVHFEASGLTTTLPEAVLSKMPLEMRQKLTGQAAVLMVNNHDCGKAMPSSAVKDKVVLMELGTCDASQKALMAQRAGAKAIILVHQNNTPPTIQITSGLYQDSIKIPCYTVRRDIGKRIGAMLPSKVGIKRPDTMPVNAEALRGTNNGNATAQNQQQQQGNDQTENPLDNVAADNTNNPNRPNYANDAQNLNSSPFKLKDGTRYNWRISPNPTTDFTTVAYRFSKPTDVSIEVFNGIGQAMSHHTYKAATSGSIDIDVTNWASGTYTVHLITQGNTPSVKKVVVQH